MTSGAAGAGPRVLLVRHGESVANVQNRLQGRLDSPLSLRGSRQVEAVARRISEQYGPLEAVYCSPLQRAWYTARAIARRAGREPVPMEDLLETDIGAATGLTWEQFAAQWPDHAQALRERQPDTRWPQGETLREVAARSRRAVSAILRQHETGSVVAVSHGGTLRWPLAALLSGSEQPDRRSSFENCGITEVLLTENTPTLVCLNDTTHLAPQSTP